MSLGFKRCSGMVTAGAHFFKKGDLCYRQKLSLIRDYMDYT